MREIKFRAWHILAGCYVYTLPTDHWINLDGIIYRDSEPCHRFILEQYTGYRMNGEDVFFGDLVSNNYHTDKEVIREVTLHEGNMMLKRIKGKSSLPKYIPLHSFKDLNYQIIGNIHEAI